MKCKICNKEHLDEFMSVECPDCYLKGFDIEREKLIKEFQKRINSQEFFDNLIKLMTNENVLPKDDRFEMSFDIVEKLNKIFSEEGEGK